MYAISKVTSDPFQQQTLILDDGSSLFIQMRFSSQQYGWFFTQIVHQTFTLNGLRICNLPNMLQQFRNQIPFGIGCYSLSNREPSLIGDFSTGQSTLFVLTSADVEAYQSILSGTA